MERPLTPLRGYRSFIKSKTKSRHVTIPKSLNFSWARNDFIIGPGGNLIHRIGDRVEIHAAKEITLDLKINHISGLEIDSNHTDSYPVDKQPGVTNYVSNNSIVVVTTPYVGPIIRFSMRSVRFGRRQECTGWDGLGRSLRHHQETHKN